jgi:protein TonB
VDPPEPQVPIVLRLVSRPQPSFPRAALVEGVFKGSVVARLTIGTDGRVGAVTIVSSNPPRLFDRAAQSALSNWRFEPIPRPTTAQIELAFRAE